MCHWVFLLEHPLDLVLVGGLVGVEIRGTCWLLNDTDWLLIDHMSRFVSYASILAGVLGLLLPVEFELSFVVVSSPFFTVMHGIITRYTVMA